MNEAVGKTMPSEVYDLTPKEADYILAGGYQRAYNALIDNRFVVANTPVAVGFYDPNSDNGNAEADLKKRQKAIASITDKKIKKQMDEEQKKQQRFMDIFM
ncbi:hypothetical protein FD27_GL001073 [Limosilactobacillus frumenti DSM 13145]|uniref:Uncharacterized protein n=1 Tax=Limosilactobacillus frumenti DSM 13145 TaxID=1423746 RepID=A0A0R1P3W5_9LACO|nr:hypothetical protein [Limosilactobacillus frumenti]KRL27319.1 hypothetical protein FD27_GL001073 [Limosilactobacillus frumenti DSM 13145]QFG72765.1 hypothetical protein LF145_05190 [Limosilactobacillus frumenti]